MNYVKPLRFKNIKFNGSSFNNQVLFMRSAERDKA